MMPPKRPKRPASPPLPSLQIGTIKHLSLSLAGRLHPDRQPDLRCRSVNHQPAPRAAACLPLCAVGRKGRRNQFPPPRPRIACRPAPSTSQLADQSPRRHNRTPAALVARLEPLLARRPHASAEVAASGRRPPRPRTGRARRSCSTAGESALRGCPSLRKTCMAHGYSARPTANQRASLHSGRARRAEGGLRAQDQDFRITGGWVAESSAVPATPVHSSTRPPVHHPSNPLSVRTRPYCAWATSSSYGVLPPRPAGLALSEPTGTWTRPHLLELPCDTTVADQCSGPRRWRGPWPRSRTWWCPIPVCEISFVCRCGAGLPFSSSMLTVSPACFNSALLPSARQPLPSLPAHRVLVPLHR